MNRSNPRRARLGCEPLEGRCVPTTAVLANGVLTVIGTDGADQLIIRSSKQVAGGARRPEQIQVIGVGQFPGAQVRSVEVFAGLGDDVVLVNLRRVGPQSHVEGGDGNDFLRGRFGPDILLGGAGNDVIQGRGGKDVLDPGVGNNWVNGKNVVVGNPFSNPTPAPAPTPTSPTPSEKPGWVLITPEPTPSIDIAAWVDAIYRLTNQERSKAGLNALTINPKLVALAQLQANQMVQFGKMQHEIPGAQYPTMQSRADAVGYSLSWLGENLAYGYGDPEGVVQGWMMSTGHRENMLFAPFTEMGVAIAVDASGRPYIALEFGTPKG